MRIPEFVQNVNAARAAGIKVKDLFLLAGFDTI